MAEQRRGWWSRGFNYLLDGTFQEVLEARAKRQDEPFSSHFETDENGFLVLRKISFDTRKVDFYKTILKDPEKWRVFETDNVNRYFRDQIELFPYDRASAVDAPIVAADETPASEDEVTDEPTSPGKKKARKRKERAAAPVDATHDYAAPGRFYKIQKGLIERRFPFGRDQTVGDADLRDHMSAMRHLFAENFWKLILSRRFVALSCMLAGLAGLGAHMLTMFGVGAFGAAMWGAPAGVAIMICAAVLMMGVFIAATWFAFDRFEVLKDQYEAAVRESCLLMGRNLQVRQQDIIANIPQIFTEADNDKYALKSENRLREWPEEVRKWTKLAFWMAGRAESNELFMQLEMWRVRRLHFGMKWTGTLWSTLLAAFGYAAFAALVAAAAIGIWSLAPIWAKSPPSLFLTAVATSGLGAVTCLVFIHTLVRGADRRSLVDLDLIEKSILTNNIQGHKDVRLHDRVAEQLFREKSALLHEEEKTKR
jgi:hypothetical protein